MPTSTVGPCMGLLRQTRCQQQRRQDRLLKTSRLLRPESDDRMLEKSKKQTPQKRIHRRVLRYLAASWRLSGRESTGPPAPRSTRAIGSVPATNGDRESRYCESRSATIRAPCSLK